MSLAEDVFPLVMRNIKFVGYHRELSTFSPALSCPKTVNSALPSDFVAVFNLEGPGSYEVVAVQSV